MIEIKDQVLAWVNSVTAKNLAVEAEREQRQLTKTLCFPTVKRGVQRYALDNGYKVKLQQTYTYKLGIKEIAADNPINKQVEALQEAIAELGNEGPMLADRLIRWKPELVDSEYRKLNVEFPVEKAAKELIDQLLTITEGSPQMELEEPK